LRSVMQHLKIVCISEAPDKFIIHDRNDIDIVSLPQCR
jgi:hypothetical protein